MAKCPPDPRLGIFNLKEADVPQHGSNAKIRDIYLHHVPILGGFIWPYSIPQDKEYQDWLAEHHAQHPGSHWDQYERIKVYKESYHYRMDYVAIVIVIADPAERMLFRFRWPNIAIS
jgi:hypothetical protein